MNTKPDSYTPISGNELPRFTGISTFMRLPYVAPVDAGVLGELPQVNSITTYVVLDSPKNARG